MAVEFINIDRETPFLLPASVQDYVAEKHLARFITEIVSQLDLREMVGQYSGRGSKPWPPSMMVALLFYGYATGIFSSRKLERASHDSLAFRYICANTHPDHDSIATFRRHFAKPLEACFMQILLIASTMGVLKLGTVSLDGTKVKANANRNRALSWEYANKLEEQLKQEVAELMRMSEEADNTQIPDDIDIPAELSRREERLATIARAKQEIQRRAEERHAREVADYEGKIARRKRNEEQTGKKPGGKEPKPPIDKATPRPRDQVNLTDEESRIMPSGGGFEQAYNAQVGVDIESYLVVENHITQAANDKREVGPTLAKLATLPAEVGMPEAMLADSGFCGENNVELCENKGVTPYFAQARQKHNRPLSERFGADPEPPCENASVLARMQHRMKTKDGKALYARRKCTVETVIGIIKHVLGFRAFSMRGLELAGAEWSMVCSAWNLKRMHILMG
ncbi:MAG: IS1182 family transposase [Alphaproteobacteria bacterium]|jgi:transposase|nr:IS1182 family transposase [Alphaproteobacteria bacterium]HIJ42732.1 transposase [Rhodospirillaceae bacterium]